MYKQAICKNKNEIVKKKPSEIQWDKIHKKVQFREDVALCTICLKC